MKKVCMIAYTYYLSDPRVRKEAEALSVRGDMIDFICLRKDGEKQCDYVNGVNLYRLSQRRYRGSNKIAYIIGYVSFFISAFKILTSLFMKKKYDVIHINTLPDFLVFCAIIPKLFGTKILLDIHDLTPELLTSKFHLKEKHHITKILKTIESRSVKFASYVITPTLPLKNTLLRRSITNSKCSVIMNLPDNKIFNREKFRVKTNSDIFSLVYHGTVVERYGLDVAIKAISLVKDKIPNIKFYVYGEGDALPSLFSLTERLKLKNKIYFSERFVPWEKIPKLIGNKDIGISPRRKDKVTDTALSTKLLEYVAMGIPVIVSETTLTAKYFDNSMVMFFEAGNEEDLAKKIFYLYKNPKKRKKLVQNADMFNQDYNWEKEKQKYYRIIDELADS